MTRIRETRCDACGDEITFAKRLKATFKRKLRLRLFGAPDYPDEFGWSEKRVDLCGECWERILETVSEEVSDE